ncbi:hypothetical protein GGF31_007095 [Allomyces arbusculus]|nr:hypothetical protein GGF31_007095 [Allomyces arbusculus]
MPSTSAAAATPSSTVAMQHVISAALLLAVAVIMLPAVTCASADPDANTDASGHAKIARRGIDWANSKPYDGSIWDGTRWVVPGHGRGSRGPHGSSGFKGRDVENEKHEIHHGSGNRGRGHSGGHERGHAKGDRPDWGADWDGHGANGNWDWDGHGANGNWDWDIDSDVDR